MLLNLDKMKNSILTYSILISIVMYGCNSKGVDRLEKTILPYSELPNEVKQHIFSNDFIDLNNPNKYKAVSKKHKLLGWIYETEIHRKSDSKIFKMESLKGEWGSHLIILGDYLYIPNHYNIYEHDSLKYNFTRFKFE
jgi:hypothetical protein